MSNFSPGFFLKEFMHPPPPGGNIRQSWSVLAGKKPFAVNG